jgi:replicative DNA helicase
MIKEQTAAPKLDLDFFESILLLNVLTDREYLSSIIGYVDPTFFNDRNIGKVISKIGEFFTERGSVPTITEIKARLTSDEDKKALSEVKQKLSQLENNFNKDELIQNTEKFLKERFVYKTILNVAEKFSDQSFNLEEVLADFEKAYNITLKENLGHWYFDDVDKHIKELTAIYNPIPTGWKFLDDRTEGGLFPKTLTVFAGQVNVGKSIVLGNIATNILLADKNVLLISLEMSEFMYSKRISAQLTQIPHNDLKSFTTELKDQINHIKNQIDSKLVVKEYPPKTVTVRHLDSFITKLKHKGFQPDIVVIDYINLIHPIAKNLNSYESVKEIAEHLRALSFKYNIPFVSATQLNRGSFNTASPGMEGISECIEVNQIVTFRDGTKKRIGDIQFGDQVTSNDGFKTVTQVHHKKIKPCYKIKLKSGKEITVSDKHKFPTNRGRISIVDGIRVGDRLNSIVCKKETILSATVKRILNFFSKDGAKNSIT